VYTTLVPLFVWATNERRACIKDTTTKEGDVEEEEEEEGEEEVF